MFKANIFFVLIALISGSIGEILKEQVLPSGYPNVHKISLDKGVLKCGEVTCPQGSFRCSIETVSDEIRGQDGMSDTMTTWTKCTNQKLKVLKTHSTTMRSPKPDMKITIKTSASIDGVEKNESMSEQGRLKSQGMPFRLFEIATSVQPPATTETFSMRSAFKH